MGIQFAMKGYKGKTVHTCASSKPIEMKGIFHLKGPQPIGEGGAPEWIGELFAQCPDIETIAINTKDKGVIYARMD